jgi:YHS domain-containing protein
MEKRAQWALVGAAWFFALSVAGLGFMAYRRLNSPPAAAAAPPASTWGLRSDGTALCPVTGEVLQVVSSTPRVDYVGAVYYFSADKDGQGLDARMRFLMDPERYLKAVPQR